MSVRVRIAPSPTGNLHIGTARTAVFNWLYARHHGGTFILRVEDTDTARSRPEYVANIKDGLHWLGIDWDEGPYFQSERLPLYRDAVQTLLDKGLAYFCYTSEDELTALRDRQKARNQAPRYDNRHRHLAPEQRAAFEAEGRRPVVRFKIDDEREIVWDDRVRGRMVWKGSDLGGDMVVARRSDSEPFGQPLYNLAVVVDDLDMQISHVIRGEDHIANTAKQILLYEALGGTVPEFAHTPLILNEQGQKLSKRDNVTSVGEFREMGFLPEAIANYMALLGWTPPDREGNPEIFTLSEAAALFDLERVSKSGAKFDWDKLNWLNSQYLHSMPPARLVELLAPYWEAAGFEFDVDRDRAWLEDVAALIATSLTRLSDAAEQSRVFFVPDLDVSEAAVAQLQQEGVAAIVQGVEAAIAEHAEFDEETAQGIVKQITKDCGVKKGVVMKSLRAALTGDLRGHDLMQSWLLFRRHELDRPRLQQALAIARG